MTSTEKRVIAFDATALIARAFSRRLLDAYTRRNLSACLSDFFPQPDFYRCACGCGRMVQGWQNGWATPECCAFATDVVSILAGQTKTIRRYLEKTKQRRCAWCLARNKNLTIDHIVPVSQGGAGRWLANYQLLCQGCHNEKTEQDARRYAVAAPV